MIIEFTGGKIITNQYETVVRLNGPHHITLQAQNDALTLIGGANVLAANGAECKWSLKLDSATQLEQLSAHTSIAIQ